MLCHVATSPAFRSPEPGTCWGWGRWAAACDTDRHEGHRLPGQDLRSRTVSSAPDTAPSSFRVFSSESALPIRWPEDWSFSVSPGLLLPRPHSWIYPLCVGLALYCLVEINYTLQSFDCETTKIIDDGDITITSGTRCLFNKASSIRIS